MKLNLDDIIFVQKNSVDLVDFQRPVPTVSWLDRNGKVHSLSYDDDGVNYDGDNIEFLSLDDFQEYSRIVNRITRHQPRINSLFVENLARDKECIHDQYTVIKKEDYIIPFRHHSDSDYEWYAPSFNIEWNSFYIEWNPRFQEFNINLFNIDNASDFFDDFSHLSDADFMWVSKTLRAMDTLQKHHLLASHVELPSNAILRIADSQLTPEDIGIIQMAGLDGWMIGQKAAIHYEEVTIF